MRMVWVWAAALACVPLAVKADPPMYNVRVLSFDMWCQETQHWDPDRCDQRLAADEEQFEAYRATIERFELPYLKRREEDVNLHTRVIDNDVAPRRNGIDPQ